MTKKKTNQNEKQANNSLHIHVSLALCYLCTPGTILHELRRLHTHTSKYTNTAYMYKNTRLSFPSLEYNITYGTDQYQHVSLKDGFQRVHHKRSFVFHLQAPNNRFSIHISPYNPPGSQFHAHPSNQRWAKSEGIVSYKTWTIPRDSSTQKSPQNRVLRTTATGLPAVSIRNRLSYHANDPPS